MDKHNKGISKRRENRSVVGRFRGGVLAPVMAVPFHGNEGGTVNQEVTFELDPIAGRMLTPITAEVVSIFVPLNEIRRKQIHSTNGSPEGLRRDLMMVESLFGLEPENELTQRMGIIPRSIGGFKQVCTISRLAHNVAVNFLRRRKFVDALQVDLDNVAVTPALLSSTVLDRLHGVLDPDEHIGGAVELELGNMQLPVKGIGLRTDVTHSNYDGTTDVRETEGENDPLADYDHAVGINSNRVLLETNNLGWPRVFADFEGVDAGGVSLRDFYRAERVDAMTREFRDILDKNPENGEELIARFAHGLKADNSGKPFVVYENEHILASSMRYSTEAANLDVAQTDLGGRIGFTAVVPPSEFGGILITFACIKPDETIALQPHPMLTEPWGKVNHAADTLKIDPVPVTVRELDADCDSADEGTIAFYTGNNELLRNYTNYGLSRSLDPTTVANKTAIWQLQVPMSVTPQSILYPDDLEHYPFQDQLAEVCTYTVSSNAVVATPRIFGPRPVENMAVLDGDNIFGEE